jgi:hypothetical protein
MTFLGHSEAASMNQPITTEYILGYFPEVRDFMARRPGSCTFRATFGLPINRRRPRPRPVLPAPVIDEELLRRVRDGMIRW